MSTGNLVKSTLHSSYFALYFSERRERAEPPSFLKRIGDLEAYDGMKAKFTACCNGYPEPSIEWYKDGVRIEPSERYKIENEAHGLIRLTIEAVTRNDVGKYRCRAFNPHGEDSCVADLIFDRESTSSFLNSRISRRTLHKIFHFQLSMTRTRMSATSSVSSTNTRSQVHPCPCPIDRSSPGCTTPD